jgi:DNA-binding transcriptional ArsR family regulator
MATEQRPQIGPAQPTEPVLEVSSPEHFKALAHPTRQRIMFALSQPATVSQLATAIGTAKGNIAHHLGVLRGAGLVSPAGTRQVRGGTEQYFRRAAPVIRFAGDHAAANLPIALGAVAEEITAADPDPFLMLRYLRLTPAQAQRITAVLTDLASTSDGDQRDSPGQARPGPEPAGSGVEPTGPGDLARYGLLLAFYRPPEPTPGRA